MDTIPMELVSIVLPTLQAEKYLSQAVDSILAQTYSAWELIVVDGGSKDATLEILARYSDPRIRLVHQPANSGKLPGALNLGFQHARGAYLTWMQADDLYEPPAIATLVEALEQNPTVDFVYSDYWWIDEHGSRLRKEVVPAPEEMARRNCIGHYFIYRRAVMETVGEYDFVYYMAEDYEYWLRVSQKHNMMPIHNAQYLYRAHPDSLTFKDYGRYYAIRVTARARRRWLRTTLLAYHRDVARAYIEEAFSSYGQGDLKHCRAVLLNGLRHNPGWLANRGVLSLLAQSVFGWRRKQPGQPRLENR